MQVVLMHSEVCFQMPDYWFYSCPSPKFISFGSSLAFTVLLQWLVGSTDLYAFNF